MQRPRPPKLTPLQWAPSSSAAYGMATVLALVASGYFFLWLQAGGAQDIARTLKFLLESFR